MRTPRKTSIIVVGGALAIASAGYGLGSQADDGTAVARGGQTSTDDGRGRPPGLQALARKLGVDADELAQAFRDFHEQEEGTRHEELGAALADALGISARRVNAASERLRQRQEARFAARLAQALNVGTDELKAALDKLKSEDPGPPHELAQALADELGVDAADVRRALFDTRGEAHRHRGLPLRQLAAELGVTRAELRRAFRELRAGAGRGFEEHEQALAKFLAERFDLSVDDVTTALDALPRPVRPGHGGRLGPGGPEHGPGFDGDGPRRGMYPAPEPS